MSITINGATNTLTAASGLTIAGNTAVTGTLSATDNVTVTKSTNAPLQYEAVNLNTGNSVTSGFKATVNGTNTFGSFLSFGSGIGTSSLWATALGTRIIADSGMTGGLALAAREASAPIRFFAGGIADANQVGVFSSTGLAVTGTLSLNETVPTGITLNVFNASETGTVTGGNTLLRLASNASGADSTIQFTDSVANNSYISGKSGHIYIQPNTAGISVADFSPTALTLGSGVNLVMASGQGIDFSATANGSGTTTSEVLSDYEEGTWTPTIGSGSGTITTATATGSYVKVGRMVHATVNISITDAGTGAGALTFTVPFTSNASGNSAAGSGAETAAVGFTGTCYLGTNSVTVSAYKDGFTTPIGTGNGLIYSIVYQTA